MKFKDLSAPNTSDGKNKVWLSEKSYQEVSGVFVGEPNEYRIHWVNGKVVCSGPQCEHCEMAELSNNKKLKSQFRFVLSFIHKGPHGGLQSSIYEGDIFAYRKLVELNNQSPLEKTVVRIYKHQEGNYFNDMFEQVKVLDNAEAKNVNDFYEASISTPSGNDSDIPF